MKKRQAELQAEVDCWLPAAEAADAEDDRLHGNKRGEELPDWVADKQKRIARIAEAKAELEAEAKGRPTRSAASRRSRRAARPAAARRPASPPSDEPAPNSQKAAVDSRSSLHTP
jgi:hypothetical protein